MTDFRLFGTINLGLPLALAAIYDRNGDLRFNLAPLRREFSLCRFALGTVQNAVI
ncbi:MAG: hypothetical protein HXK63_07880 [Campylobacter sp.]|nr:hypothetical protein [uncultured Campylobacter sp.]MBF0985035.1 hypothetical protein [Campylobacter sp.]